MTEIEDDIVTAVEKAADRAGTGFNALISIHLKHRHNSNLREMAKTPQELHKALVELFGDYTTRLLETLAVEILLRGESRGLARDGTVGSHRKYEKRRISEGPGMVREIAKRLYDMLGLDWSEHRNDVP